METDISEAYHYIEDDDYDVMYHLAWGGVASEEKNDVELQIQNINLTLDALDLCKKIKCPKFIAAGTVAEYSLSNDIIDMNAQQTPNDIYGAAKVATHYFLDVKARAVSQPYIWAILPSTFGERRNDSNIITYTIKTLLKGESPQYGNLLQMWDFLYVKEVARALVALGELGHCNKIYGIGSGEFRMLRDYIIEIRDIINPKIELGIGEIESFSSNTFSSCANIYSLVKDTGYMPHISFHEGIIRTIDYYKEQMNREDS